MEKNKNTEEKKHFELDGSKMKNLDQFYDEVEKTLTKSFKMGRNLDALNDVLRGGFGVFDSGESIVLTWKHSKKSKAELPKYDRIIDVIRDHPHIELIFS